MRTTSKRRKNLNVTMPAAYFTVSHVHLYCPSSYLATELVDRVLINALTSLREIWNRGENVIE